MFERFTSSARDTVVRAQQLARDGGSTVVGSEHLLLALLDGDSGPGSPLQGAASVDADKVRAEVKRLNTGTPPGSPLRTLTRCAASGSISRLSWPGSKSLSVPTR